MLLFIIGLLRYICMAYEGSASNHWCISKSLRIFQILSLDIFTDRRHFIILFVHTWLLSIHIFPILSSTVGNLCMITGGRNLGRVGTVVNRERHPGSFDIVHIKDTQGHTFATR
jgi:hypothetical protein